MPRTKSSATRIFIESPRQAAVKVCLVGVMPYIAHRLSEAAKHELLLPRGRKTAADKKTTLKHDPIAEFRSSCHLTTDDSSDTLIEILATAVKAAMMTAAMDTPGTAKSQIGRLTWVEGHVVPLYGIPRLFMTAVRSADMARTPDIRTRAIFPKWATRFTVSFLENLVEPQAVFNLLATAGRTTGLGDWRPEKGKGTFGQFRVCAEDDPEFQEIVATGGRAAQEEAIREPVPMPGESTELLAWYLEEVEGRASARNPA